MSLKDNYEKTKIEIIAFTSSDIITASSDIDESMSTGSGNKTEDGWTPLGW